MRRILDFWRLSCCGFEFCRAVTASAAMNLRKCDVIMYRLVVIQCVCVWLRCVMIIIYAIVIIIMVVIIMISIIIVFIIIIIIIIIVIRCMLSILCCTRHRLYIWRKRTLQSGCSHPDLGEVPEREWRLTCQPVRIPPEDNSPSVNNNHDALWEIIRRFMREFRFLFLRLPVTNPIHAHIHTLRREPPSCC